MHENQVCIIDSFHIYWVSFYTLWCRFLHLLGKSSTRSRPMGSSNLTGNFLILILRTFKIGMLIKFIACHRKGLETNRQHNNLKCTGSSQCSLTLEALRKYGLFMSWSWCHHGKKKGEKKKRERVEIKPGLMALSPVLKFALTHLKICYITTCVTFGLYSLTTFSSYFVIFSVFLTFWITNSISLFSSSLVSSLPLLPVNIFLPNLS